MDSILDSLDASASKATLPPNREPASTRVSPRDDTIANALLTLRETTRIYGDHHSLNDDTAANVHPYDGACHRALTGQSDLYGDEHGGVNSRSASSCVLPHVRPTATAIPSFVHVDLRLDLPGPARRRRRRAGPN